MTEKPDYEKIGTSLLGEELSMNECQVMTGIMETHHYKDGETLISKSGKEHTLFVLIDGKLDVSDTSEGQEISVYTMKKGEVAGTRAFVDRTPREATLRAVGDTTVYTLEPVTFETLLDKHPRIAYKVMRSLFRITHANLLRLNQQTAQLSNYISKSGGRY